MIVIDKLCYRSKLRYVNAFEKFIFAVATLLIVIISRSVIVAAVVLAANGILTVKKGGIPLFRYVRLMAVPLAFILLSTLTLIINISRMPLSAYALPVGSWYITGSVESLKFGGQLIITAMAAVSCLYFLSLNTTMTDILSVLARLHCPKLLIELMLLIYRFIFVLMDVASAITISQKSRLGNKDIKTSVSSFGKMGAVLFIRAMKRSGALFDAMESRCYDGAIHILEENHPPKPRELAAIGLFEMLLLAMLLLEKYL